MSNKTDPNGPPLLESRKQRKAERRRQRLVDKEAKLVEQQKLEEHERALKAEARAKDIARLKAAGLWKHPIYPNLKAAYADGWRKRQEDEIDGEEITIKGQLLVRNTTLLEFVFKSNLRERYGLTPKMIEQLGGPDKIIVNPHYSQKTASLYRVDKIERWLAENGKPKSRQKLRVQIEDVTNMDVLQAMFTLNRRAKRCRDLAQSYYQHRLHGFAKRMKEEKERIYELKGQVLGHFVELGILTGGKFHQFERGNWAEVLEGDGFRFHRPCPPRESDGGETIECIESMPKGKRKLKLDTANAVLETFLQDKSPVIVFEWTSDHFRSNRDLTNEHCDDDELDEDDLEGEYWDIGYSRSLVDRL